MKREGSAAAKAQYHFESFYFFVNFPGMQLAALLVSLQSLPSIPRRAQHTHFLTKQTNTHKTLRFFFVVRTSVFFPKVRNESIPNCATLERKSVCAWFKCCWSISARRSKRACRELQELYFLVSGTLLLKNRLKRRQFFLFIRT